VSSLQIFCSRDTNSSQWQLVTISKKAGSLSLIGWKEISSDSDGEISDKIISIIGSTLTAIARVSYPQSTVTIKSTQTDGWIPSSGDLFLNLGSGGLMERVSALVKNLPSEIILISTLSPESVAPLFNDPGYPWWLQGQIVLLSETENSAPKIDRKTMLNLLNGDWNNEIPKLLSLGIQGLFAPGVDGAVAGFYSFSEVFKELFFSEIQQQCKRLEVGWTECAEKEFSDYLAD